MIKKYSKYIVTVLVAFFISLTVIHAKELSLSELADEVLEVEPNATSVFIIGQHVFTSEHLLTTQDTMLAARTIQTSTNSAGQEIYNEMTIAYFDGTYDDDWNVVGFEFYQNIVGTTQSKNSYDICYIDYTYICDGSSGGETPSTYTIIWKNYDDSVLETDTNVNAGITPSYDGETPVREADETYTYEFIGWTPELTADSIVSGNMVYTAKYRETYIDYTVIFQDEDGTELSNTKYHYGDTVVEPTDPSKAATDEYTYTFAGWDKEVTTVSGDVTYKATYEATKNKYTVTWKNYDGTVLETDTVEYGTVPTYDGEDPIKPSDNTYTYAFDTWNREVVAVTGNTEYIATFNETYIDYTVIFQDEDGTELSRNTYHYGETVTVPTDPTKAATAEYTYEFAGWDQEITIVAGDVSYKATYTATKNKYTITFVNYDGTTLYTSEVEYGTVPSYAGETPVRAADEENNYTFTGWSPALTNVTGEATYTAQYTTATNVYTVTWKNYDGTVLETDTVEYGTVPTYDGEDPIKPSDNTYTYAFDTWDREVVAVTGNTEYIATFNEAYIDYTVIFQDEDGTELSNVTYHYGETVTAPANPSKAATAEYTYTFAGWDKEVTTVSGDVTYKATYTATKNKYTITFVNYDGTTLYTSEVEYGTVPSYAGETPVRAADEENSYTFTGWSPALTNVTGEATYTAQYTTATNVYTVTWKNYDGTVLETDTVEYGTVPTYDGEDPIKPSDNTYTYEFDTWDREVVAVTGNTEYIATFNETYIDYTVIFQDEDGTELSNTKYHYGDTVVEPTDPTKAATAEYTYTFAGWDKEVTTVSGDVTYKATYTATKNKYTVTWKNYDGTVLETDTLEYGTVPTYDGSAPTKTSDEQYDYYFAGWDRNIVAVTQDAVYEAEFGRNPRKYTITFVNYDGTTLYTSEVEYGTVPSYAGETPVREADEENNYTFTGWSPALTNVTGEATYTAQYTTATNVYTVTWKNYDGTVLETDTVEYGTVPTYDGEDPVKPSDNTYTYEFDTWDREVVAVTGNTEYIATFNETYKEYTVIFQDEDGTELSRNTYHYGDTVTAPANPSKAATAEYTYTFAGWGKEVTTVSGDVTYKATYTATKNKYTVTYTFDGRIGSLPITQPPARVVSYGELITNLDSYIDSCGYNIIGYYVNGEVFDFNTPITNDIELVVKIEPKSYTVTFKNYDGSVLATETVEYGEVPEYTGETPTKAEDNTYTYSFDGWDKELTAVTENIEYTATFKETYKEYTVIFQDEDGTELSNTKYHYGDTVVEPTDPTKEATAEYTYSFAGWDKEVTTVSSNVTYQATYTQTLRTYTVTWKNINGEIVATEEVAYGNMPTTQLINQSHGSGNGDWCAYQWPELTVITEATVYQQTGGCTYRVTWLDYDGSELEVDEDVPTGTMPTFDGELPTTVTDEIEGITYTFIGWDKEITPVTGNVTYTAKYDPELVSKYTVTWKYEDGTILQQIRVPHGETAPEYSGSTPTKKSTDEFDYVFSGWKEEHVYGYQIASMNFIAQFTEVKRSYTVTWKNYDGTVLETDTLEYGTVPTYDGTTPVKASDNTYTYEFDTWDKEVVAVTGDVTYTATFNEEYIEYTVIFQDEDGTILSDTTYHYGDTIIPPADPTKAATAEYSYDFIGWDGIVGTVTKDVVYTAEYRKIKNKYTVTWVNTDGTVLETDLEVPYGTIPTYDGDTPMKPNPITAGENFIGWSPNVTPVTGNITYTAVYSNTTEPTILE